MVAKSGVWIWQALKGLIKANAIDSLDASIVDEGCLSSLIGFAI